MIEEILKLNRYKIASEVVLPNRTYDEIIETVNIGKVLEIIDKHNKSLEAENKNKEINLPDYKSAWKELKTNESPYCEICGHCGEIGCCGIVAFLEEHIKGKTNCKNESCIIQDIISICNYETDVFKKNENLNKGIDELIEKYNERFDPKGFYLDVENTMCYVFIEDLKKLKGD